jgi:hypothetical protein
MGTGTRLAALGIAVIGLTLAVILAVGAPVVSVVSGLLGAALPVVLTYGVMEYDGSSEPS